MPDARFVIVGDGPARPSIERRIQDLGLQSRIHLVGNRNDIHRILPSMDVFALTSLNEANPVSILEALSCEVPVVASRVGSISESVLEGITGFTIDPKDCDGFVNRIYQLLCEPSLAKRIGEKGREHVLRHGSLGNMVSGYERLIHQIYNDKKSNRLGRSRQPIPI
jgi:glycosyltransferase involved in cell wall biosynthesis